VTAHLPYLRTSERKKFKDCMRAWWWAYREGYRTNSFRADALWFGTGIHLAFAEWYKPGFVRGVNPVETWTEFCGDTVGFVKESKSADADLPDWDDARELGIAMLEGYLARYGHDESWEVIAPEYAFHVLVGTPAVVNYVGTFDGVYLDHADGKYKLMEHKTAASISTGHLALDDQAGSYWAVATHELRRQGILTDKQAIAGIQYNFLRKGRPDDRPRNAAGYATNQPKKLDFVRELTGIDGWTEAELKRKTKDELDSIAAGNKLQILGEISKSQPAPLYLRKFVRRTAPERARQLQRIQDEVQHMNAVRSRALPVLKSPSRECSFCEFREPCEAEEGGFDWQSYFDYGFHRKDPYQDHRPGVEVTSKFFRER
jgi:hypothetical protein